MFHHPLKRLLFAKLWSEVRLRFLSGLFKSGCALFVVVVLLVFFTYTFVKGYILSQNPLATFFPPSTQMLEQTVNMWGNKYDCVFLMSQVFGRKRRALVVSCYFFTFGVILCTLLDI